MEDEEEGIQMGSNPAYLGNRDAKKAGTPKGADQGRNGFGRGGNEGEK